MIATVRDHSRKSGRLYQPLWILQC
jgi:hypothetical protein